MDVKRPKSAALIPLLIFSVAIPMSMLMWLGNLAFSVFAHGGYTDDRNVIPPTRWLMSTLTPIVIVGLGMRKKSLDKSGAFLALFVGFVLTVSSYAFFACLFTFFVTSSKATKFRSAAKRKFEADFKEGGQRNWLQVLCNSGIATFLALLYILDVGCGERPIDFVKDYRATWLGIGILGAFACCNGDTWASELGTVVGSGKPRLITSLRRVPRGTNGAVSVLGLAFSAAGGAVVGAAYYLAVLYTVDPHVLAGSPPQWPLVAGGAFAGLAGSLADSLLGATLQYSGLDERTGCIVEFPGKGVRHISGMTVLDNHSVNLLSSIATALLLPRVANAFWP
ncbi:transmembrane protein 19 isoform X1 [Bacillus rossius redtenbacheri]|uniref:transmembrane protein 19 isoform X1 n=1 Tax=Bacillus rossius redtenbacheri TaxID=93214 RepID=UPI002FDEF010